MAIVPFRASGKQQGRKEVPAGEDFRQRLVAPSDLPASILAALKAHGVKLGESVTLRVGQWWSSSASTVWGVPTTFIFVNLTTGETKTHEVEPYVEWEARMFEPGREEWDAPLYYPLPPDAAVIVASDAREATSSVFRSKNWDVDIYVHTSNFRALLEAPKEVLTYREYNLLDDVFRSKPEYMVARMKYYGVTVEEVEALARKGVLELPNNGLPKVTMDGRNIASAVGGQEYLWNYILRPFDEALCDEFAEQYPDGCTTTSGNRMAKFDSPLYNVRDDRLQELRAPPKSGELAYKKYAKVKIKHRKYD